MLTGFAACSFSGPSSQESAEPPAPAPAVESHYIPSSQVAVPRIPWTPHPVVEPQDPLRPAVPIQNPGAVNGDRPARAVPGLAAAAVPAQTLTTQDVRPEQPASDAAPAPAADTNIGGGVRARVLRDLHRL